MIGDIELSGRYAVSADAVWREVGGDVFVVLPNRGVSAKEDAFFTLDGVGKLIWSLLDGGHSVADIVDEVVRQFDAPRAVVTEDTVAFLEELAARGMLAR